MVSLKERSTQREMMDDFTCSGEVLNQTLKELEKINKLLGGDQVSISGLRKLVVPNHIKQFSLVDLGCGGGDTLKLMAHWSRCKGYSSEFFGVDANANIVDYASQNSFDIKNINYLNEDIFSDAFKKKSFDIAHCSLFTHHFTNDELVILLKQLMNQVEVGIIINDLHRHLISYYFTKWIIRALSKSEMVRFDSVVSVARSFKKKELQKVLKAAGIDNYSLQWKWAYRWELVIYKDKPILSI